MLSIPLSSIRQAAASDVSFKSGTAFKLQSVNAYFTLGQDFVWVKAAVDSSHLYVYNLFSGSQYDYSLWPSTPNTQFTISSWFTSASSTAVIHIDSPAATNIQLSLSSPTMVSASASGAVSWAYTAGNNTLTMVVNTSTSSTVTINANVAPPIVISGNLFKAGVKFRLRDVNTNFTLGADFQFMKAVVNATHFWIYQSYSPKHFSDYCIWTSTSTPDTSLTILTWFTSTTSTATIQINSPSSTNIQLSLHSSTMVTASASGVVSYAYTAGNKTLTMIANTDTSTVITINAQVGETDFNTPPETVSVTAANTNTTVTFKARYWDLDGYYDLRTMKLSFKMDNVWVNASYNQQTNVWTQLSGNSKAALGAAAASIVDSKVLEASFPFTLLTSISVANTTVYLWCDDVADASSGWTSYLVAYVFSVTMTLGPVSITNMECGNWVFAEDRYYAFNASYIDNAGYSSLSLVKIAFSDSIHWINVTYNQQTKVWGIDSGRDYISMYGSSSGSGVTLKVTFYIYFNSKILDSLGPVGIYSYCSDVYGNRVGWTLMQPSYFHIYNLGGYNTLQTTGTAGRVVGGDVFELYAGDNSNAEAVQYWKNMRFIDLWFNINVSRGEILNGLVRGFNSAAWYKFGIDYYYQGNWTKGLYTYITVLSSQSQYGHPFLGNDKVSVQLSVNWYYKNNIVKQELIYAYGTWDTVDGHSGSVPIHVSLWFNSANASSLMGGRVTAQYYAIADNAAWWQKILSLGLSTNWGVDKAFSPTSMCFASLTDNTGKIFSAANLKLMRNYAGVTQPANPAPTFTASARNYQTFTVDKNNPTMNGVDTPAYIEPRMPNLPQTWASSFFAGISGFFVSSIVSGLRTLINAFVGALDWLFTLAGWSGGFSQMLSWIQNFLGYMITSFTLILQMLVNDFLLIAATAGRLFEIFNMFVTTVVLFWTAANNLISQVVAFSAPFTELIVAVMPLGLIVILAMWINTFIKDPEKGIHQMKTFIGIFTGIFTFLFNVGKFSVELIWRIIQLFKGWL